MIRFPIREGPHESSRLTLEIVTYRMVLGHQPRWGLIEPTNQTMKWYQAQQKGFNAHDLCDTGISAFELTS